MSRYRLSTTELKWIINSLDHYIADVKAEMDSSPDGAPIQAFGELTIEGRENLVRKITDIIYSKTKTVSIY